LNKKILVIWSSVTNDQNWINVSIRNAFKIWIMEVSDLQFVENHWAITQQYFLRDNNGTENLRKDVDWSSINV